jgi:TPR repeat protein
MRYFTAIALITISLLYSKTSIQELEKMANRGSINALIKLAMRYENGDGVKVNLAKAKRYYKRAIRLGSEDAKIALALLQLDEQLNRKDISLKNNVVIQGDRDLTLKLSLEDLKNIVSRAKRMDKDALFTLATIYENGLGSIKADKDKAISLYKKAAKLGSRRAKNVLRIKGLL